MRYCTRCGNQVDDSFKFCMKCGNELVAVKKEENSTQVEAVKKSPYDDVPPNLSKRDYIRDYADSKIRKEINNSAITGYICTGISAIVALAFDTFGVLSIIEFLILIGLIVGFHIYKSKACVILWAVLVAVEIIVNYAYTGKMSGWIMALAVYYGIVSIIRAEKEYDEYKWYKEYGNKNSKINYL